MTLVTRCPDLVHWSLRMPVKKAGVVRLIEEAAESPLEKVQLLVLVGDKTSLWSKLHEEEVVTCLRVCICTRKVAGFVELASRT